MDALALVGERLELEGFSLSASVAQTNGSYFLNAVVRYGALFSVSYATPLPAQQVTGMSQERLSELLYNLLKLPMSLALMQSAVYNAPRWVKRFLVEMDLPDSFSLYDIPEVYRGAFDMVMCAGLGLCTRVNAVYYKTPMYTHAVTYARTLGGVLP